MNTLYLVRHAKSSWKQPELSDFERPLNKRGKNDAPFMGRLLSDKGINPDLLISSPAKRARITARLIASEINFPKEEINYFSNRREV
jgi:phosphohistidine phosphatase